MAQRAKLNDKNLMVEIKVESEDDYLKIIDEEASDLYFIGFSPEKFRQDRKIEKAKPLEIVQLITAYVQVGNNPDSCADKRRRKPRADLAESLGEKKESLARYAIAYMPLVYVIRKRLIDKELLQSRFGTLKTPLQLQDIAFSGWQGENIIDFLLAFDKAVKNTGRQEQHGEEQVRRWLQIAKAGYSIDKGVKNVMKEDLTFGEALAWLKSTLE
jgi:hypothetical protein